jgi:tetratricopeptide (TPR) repeat protein
MRVRALALLTCVLSAAPVSAQFVSDQQHREALRHFRAGQQLLAAEQFTKAADAFQEALDRDSLLALAHYGQGRAYMALGRFASAVRAFTGSRDAFRALYGLSETNRQAIEQRRNEELRALRELARGGGTTQLGYEARIGELERQRTSLPVRFETPAFVSLALGGAYFRGGHLDEAEREWKAAVAADARLGEAHNNLAALYAMTGRKQEAELEVRAAEDIGFRIHPQLKKDIQALTTPNSQLPNPNSF